MGKGSEGAEGGATAGKVEGGLDLDVFRGPRVPSYTTVYIVSILTR